MSGRAAGRARTIVSSMIPLAVSGTAIIGIAVGGAVVLLITLLRREERYDAMESAERQAQEDDAAGE